MKNKKRLIIAIITIIIVVALGYYIYNNIDIQRNKEDEYQDYTPQEEISDEQLRQTKIILYFINSETGEIDTETRIIDANNLISNPYKELVEQLNKGPQSTKLTKAIQDGTVINDVALNGNTVVINVSAEFLNFQNDDNKFKIINTIVNTLTNLKEVENVRFLIDGNENEKIMDTYTKNKIQ